MLILVFNYKVLFYMKEIRVGILHSLSGTMASSEAPLVDAALFAIDEINKAGGLQGKKLIGIVEDGCSDDTTFKLKAEKLIEKDGIHVLSGCWTSSSRKVVQKIIQNNNVFLLYPVQYEGLEENPNTLYSGSCLNQQITPAIEWCLKHGYKNFYLVGSDYVFPRTANTLIGSILLDYGANILGEQYMPLGDTDFSDIAKSIKSIRPDFVISTINGSSNRGFFTHYNKLGIEFPVMSFSIAEHDLGNLSIQKAAHYLCWSYFQNLDYKENQRFLRDFGKYKKIKPISSDPVVMTYSQIHLWSQAVKEAGSLDIENIRAHLHGKRLNSPAGLIEVMPNNHIAKNVFIGKQVSKNTFQVVWKSAKHIKPEPWLGIEGISLPSKNLIMTALNKFPDLINLSKELSIYHDNLEKIVDIRTAEVKENDSQLRIINSLLNLFMKATSEKEYMDSAIKIFSDLSGCRYAGIRRLDKFGNIPYISSVGFTKQFLKSESSINIKEHQCICTRVITDKLEPHDNAKSTSYKSFNATNLLKFLEVNTEDEKAKFRKSCICSIFATMIIVPLRYKEEVLGAIHLADKREGILSSKVIKFIEAIAPIIGEAMHRFKIEKEIIVTLKNTVKTLATVVEIKDPYTAGHQQRVSKLSVAIAKELGLNIKDIDAIKNASLIHDIGKINIPQSILSKPGKIDDVEFSIIKAHPQHSYDMICKIKFDSNVAGMVLQHHERLDGSGYPEGLKDKDILFEAKVIAVADIVEALSSHRPYRPSLGMEKALTEIESGKGTLYDSEVVDVCLKLFKKKRFKF